MKAKKLSEKAKRGRVAKEAQQSYELIITEKPQAALKIAYALADAPEKKIMLGVPYYELTIKGKRIVVLKIA